jgi:hypothetical protein
VKGVQLDQAGFQASMAAQRARSSASREAVDLTAAGAGLGQLAGQLGSGTVFEGYRDGSLLLQGCKVVGLLRDGQAVDAISGEGAWQGHGGPSCTTAARRASGGLCCMP